MKPSVLGLLLAVGALCALGAVMLLSSMVEAAHLGRFEQHLCWLGLGLVGGCGAYFLPWDRLREHHVPGWLLALAVGALVLVLVPGVGTRHGGARRWLGHTQPSEFAKIVLVIFLADYAARRQSAMGRLGAGFIVPGAIAGSLVCLVFCEPDWGTACLLGTVALAMLAVGGCKPRYLVPAVVLMAGFLLLFIHFNPLRAERVQAWLHPERYRDGVGWQAWQSMLALSGGHLLGVAPGGGRQKLGFVPESQTDFILTLVGEEMGLAGTWSVLLLFAVIVYFGMKIAWRGRDPFRQFLAFGLTFLIGLQAFINIAVVCGVLPNKGIPLPFVSYGGSGTVCLLVAVGMIAGAGRTVSATDSAVDVGDRDEPT